jgi:phosphatidylinositol-3-phosphatase
MGRVLLLIVVALTTTASQAQASSPREAGPAQTEGVPAFGHVFVIIGENTELSQVTKESAPYLIGTLKPQTAWLTNYYAITHFSEANYIAMTSGQFTECEQNDGSVASCHQDVDNLFNQFDVRGVQWQSWMESMPSPCYPSSFGADATLNRYAPKHNPALFFDNVSGGFDVNGNFTPSPECTAQDIPAGTTGPNDMSYFDAALASGAVGRFNYVVPNECEDAHDNCKPPGNPVRAFDSFLSREVPRILASPAFGTDGVLVVTFDEGTTNGVNHADHVGNGGNVVFAVLSPLARPGIYGDQATHYSFLRTMEDGFGITDYLGAAASASAISIWR